MAARSTRWRAACCRSRSARRPSSAGRMLDADKIYDSPSPSGRRRTRSMLEGAVVATSDSGRRWRRSRLCCRASPARSSRCRPPFGAEGRREARLRSGAGRRRGDAESRKVTVYALRSSRNGRRPSEAWWRAGSISTAPTPPPFACGERSPPRSEEALPHVARVSPKAPISARSPATSPARSTPSATSPCCGGPRPGPSPSTPRFRWTNWRKPLRRRTLEQHLLPLTAGLDDIPALPVTPDQAGALRQGRKLIGIAAQPGLHLATDDDVPVALVELSGGELRPNRVVRGFNL